MKKTPVIFLVILTVLFFTGCGIFKKPVHTDLSEKQAPEKQVEPEQIQEPVVSGYEILEETDALPMPVVNATEQLKKQKGYFVFDPREFAAEEDIYILIFAGEKPTGGYFISVNSLDRKDNTLVITVEEKEPAPNEGVIQVLTYPSVIIKMFDLYENYEVINQDNVKFEEISKEGKEE